MRRWWFEAVVFFALPAALLRADYSSAPLDLAVTQQPPYEYAGLIVSIYDTNAGTGSQGSGAVVGNSKIVISCAHLPFENTASLSWSSDNTWFRAYENSFAPTRAGGQPLPGYMKFASYANMVPAHGMNSADSFAVDFTAFYAYEDLGAWERGILVRRPGGIGLFRQQDASSAIRSATSFPGDPAIPNARGRAIQSGRSRRTGTASMRSTEWRRGRATAAGRCL